MQKDADSNEAGVHLKETKMILDLVLSIIVTLGASGPSGNFNECPPADQPDAVAAVQVIDTVVDQA